MQPQDLGIGRLFGAIRETVIVADIDTGQIVLWNPAAESMFGYSSDEAVGHSLEELVPEVHRARQLVGPTGNREMDQGFLLDTHTTVEAPARRKTGEDIIIEVSLNSIDDPGGERYVLAVIRDVTQRRRAALEHLHTREQAARAEAEAERLRLLNLFMQAPAMMAYLRGPQHVVEFINPPALRLLGQRDIVGKPAREAAPELEEQGLIDLLDRVYATGEPFVGSEYPAKIDRGGGRLEEGYFNFVYQPMRDSSGAVDGILAHGIEVTEQVQARKRIQELAEQAGAERDRLQQLLDVLPEGIDIADRNGRIVMVNAIARAITGNQQTRPVDLESHDRLGTFYPDGSPCPVEDLPLVRSLRQGKTVRGEQLLVRNRATDALVPILISTAPLRDGSGAITGAVAVYQDISALKEFERQKDEFLAAAAHDLKTPLTSIRGYAQLLARQLASSRVPDSERLAKSLASIDASVTRMVRLIDELLDVTRLQMGRLLDLDRRPTDLLALARQVAAEQQQTTRRHDVRVTSAERALIGEWDAVRLERALSNLVNNAIKYSPEGGEVTVEVARDHRPEGDWAVLQVHDQGVGIPSFDLPRIFGRFQRGSNIVGRIGGTGIGLAAARQIAEQHGGTIAVQSQEGVGSVFTIRLPLERAEGQRDLERSRGESEAQA